jgi:hypothetical protein
VLATVVVPLAVHASLIAAAAIALAHNGRRPSVLAINLAEMGLQILTCTILYNDVGFLTPETARSAPPIRLPLRWYWSSDVELDRLMPLIFLSDEEVTLLPSLLAHQRRYKGLTRRVASRVTTKDLLRVKHHLRLEASEVTPVVRPVWTLGADFWAALTHLGQTTLRASGAERRGMGATLTLTRTVQGATGRDTFSLSGTTVGAVAPGGGGRGGVDREALPVTPSEETPGSDGTGAGVELKAFT